MAFKYTVMEGTHLLRVWRYDKFSVNDAYFQEQFFNILNKHYKAFYDEEMTYSVYKYREYHKTKYSKEHPNSFGWFLIEPEFNRYLIFEKFFHSHDYIHPYMKIAKEEKMKVEHTIKEIVKDNTAKFSHYVDGNMYYTVDVGNVRYMFHINIFDREDLGTTTLLPEYKAITLMRYIRKSMESGNLIRIK